MEAEHEECQVVSNIPGDPDMGVPDERAEHSSDIPEAMQSGSEHGQCDEPSIPREDQPDNLHGECKETGGTSEVQVDSDPVTVDDQTNPIPSLQNVDNSSISTKEVFFEKLREEIETQIKAESDNPQPEKPHNTRKDSTCTMSQEQGDLFDVSTDWSFCHCVSQDFAMSKGIAVKFRQKFGKIKELKN